MKIKSTRWKLLVTGSLLTIGISATAQTELSITNEYTNQFTTANGKLMWRDNSQDGDASDQGLVVYDPGTGTETFFSNVRDIANLTSYGNFAIGRANDTGGGSGQGMMWTDGTRYEMLVIIGNQGESNFVYNDVIYQIGKRDTIGTVRTGNSARKLWYYDLKTSTGGQLTDLNPDAAEYGNGNFRRVAPFGDGLFLGIRDASSSNNHIPYLADGSAYATTSLSSDAVTQDEPFMSISSSLVLFLANSATDGVGTELYKYDGTSISNVADHISGSSGGNFDSQIGYKSQLGFTHNGYAYFTGRQSDNTGLALLRSDGTTIETVKVFSTTNATAGNGNVNSLVAVSDTQFVFEANDETAATAAGQELWVSDGTPGGTMMLMDINSGASGSTISWMTPVDGGAIFYATDGIEIGIYFTDGTVSGTMLISDLSLHNGAKALRAIGSKAYFIDNDNKLFELDIPVPGTTTFTTTWDLGEPTATTNAIVDGDLIVSTDLSIQNLDVQSGSITVESGATLTITGDIFNKESITIESGGSLITYDEEYVIGNKVVFERNTSASATAYSFVGIPIEEDASITGADLGSTTFYYDETLGLNGWTDASSEVLQPGIGYAQAFQDMISFTGTPNTGDITVADATFTTGTADEQGYTLLSNPYPAAINAQDFINANPDLTGTIFLWDDDQASGDEGSGDYLTITALGTVDQTGPHSTSEFDGHIASMQGFFVKLMGDGSTATSSDITFTEDMRVTGENTDGNFFRVSTETPLNIRLSIANEEASFYNELLVGLREDATTGYDRLYDGNKFSADPSIAFYSLIEDNKFAIQGLPLEEGVSTELAFNLLGDHNLTLSVEELTGLEHGSTFFLYDKVSDTMYDLSHTTSINFHASEGSQQNRFTLTYGTSEVLAADKIENQPVYKYLNQVMQVSFVSNLDIVEYAIFDLNGKVLSKSYSPIRNTNTLALPIDGTGIKIVKLVTSEGTFTRKFAF